MLHINSPNSPSFSPKFFCDLCHYGCCKKSDFEKHTSSTKHKTNDCNNKCNESNNKCNWECNNCKKIYKSRVGLWRHKKICNIEILPKNIIIQNEPDKDIVSDASNNDIIQLLIKENTDFKNMLMDMMKNTTDLVKNNTDLQKQMLEMCKNNNNTTINTNSVNNNNINDNSNKTFNLQVFLNEKCKNAMNLDDFANSIQLKLSDLIRVGEEGYVPGMSKVIIERLLEKEVCDRPIHCSDEKREAVQVKMANKWEREAIDSVNLMNAVRIVEQKQFDMLTTFRDTYPECMNSESHHNDMLIKLFQNLSNSKQPEFIKVMKKVAKSVVINKENA